MKSRLFGIIGLTLGLFSSMGSLSCSQQNPEVAKYLNDLHDAKVALRARAIRLYDIAFTQGSEFSNNLARPYYSDYERQGSTFDEDLKEIECSVRGRAGLRTSGPEKIREYLMSGKTPYPTIKAMRDVLAQFKLITEEPLRSYSDIFKVEQDLENIQSLWQNFYHEECVRYNFAPRNVL